MKGNTRATIILVVMVIANNVQAIDKITTPVRELSYGNIHRVLPTKNEKYLVTLPSYGSARIPPTALTVR